MTDPITIGALVASALGLAGEAILKGAVGEAVKDSYRALKDKISSWAGNDVEALEKTPTSAARQAVVAEIVDAQPVEEVTHARALAEQLIAALESGGSNIGLDIGRLKAREVRLGTVKVQGGTGARIGEAHVAGTFGVEKIEVEAPSGKV
jgi:hypothetical protein